MISRKKFKKIIDGPFVSEDRINKEIDKIYDDLEKANATIKRVKEVVGNFNMGCMPEEWLTSLNFLYEEKE